MTRWKMVTVSGALMVAAWVSAAGAQTTVAPPTPAPNPQLQQDRKEIHKDRRELRGDTAEIRGDRRIQPVD